MSNDVLQARIDIAAPPSRVWALISGLGKMKPLGPVQAGTRTVT